MEPQENYEYCNKCSKKPCNCLSGIICILFSILLGVIGLILGAVFAVLVIISLPAIIVFAVIIALLIALLLFYKICACKKRKCE